MVKVYSESISEEAAEGLRSGNSYLVVAATLVVATEASIPNECPTSRVCATALSRSTGTERIWVVPTHPVATATPRAPRQRWCRSGRLPGRYRWSRVVLRVGVRANNGRD